MRRRDFLKTTGGAAAISSMGCGAAARPNILLIVTDQQHLDTIAHHGNPHVRTPALDHLAQRGTSFVNSYCPDPVCSPSRSAIFTGRMASEADVAGNGRHIRADIPNVGQWFRENSAYETVYAGKWHLPRSYQDTIAGFDVLPGGIGGQGNVGDTCVSRACEGFLRNRSKPNPFLLVASFMQPHDICEWLRLNMDDPGELRYPEIREQLPPLPENFDYDPIEPKAIQQRRLRNEPAKGGWTREHWRFYRWSYYRHIEMVDGEIGRILEAIEDTGRANSTLVLFTSDHGEGMGHHQMVRKSSSYDESSKVPLLVSWPGELAADHHDTDNVVSGVDLVPTMCDVAGIPPPPGAVGHSLCPLAAGAAAPATDGHIVTEIPVNIGRIVRTRDYKFISYAGDTVEQL
ncbi:MAG: sulfatase-like hydrolase/transferase, partial [bacterium]|nr:sulfatase-like hydrolase/transferase [bacterium]